jgi:hypothetical protein
MNHRQIPLALALAAAIGAMAAGCARDATPAADTDAVAATEAAPVDADADAHATADAHPADDHGGTDVPVPVGHVRWTPDAPLKEGMSRVRDALAGLEAESHPSDAAIAGFATEIDAAVAYMFANCKLDTEPDVALHGILARLLADTRALNANPSDGSPVADMHEAMHNYERLFADSPAT